MKAIYLGLALAGVASVCMAAALRPVWTQTPSEDDMIAVYPPSALAAQLGGKAVVSCRVTPNGELGGCELVSEDPAGQGFGQAALGLAPTFRMQPQLLSGESAVGRQLNIPIRF